jgi:hypothetical protein
VCGLFSLEQALDRIETYIGQSIYEWDFSKPDQNKMVALAKITAAIFGTNTFANGLACTPQSPNSMLVNIGAGELYQLESLEATACGTLPADTTHQIMKQGIALDAVAVPNANTGVTALTAPATSGQSINYLIEAQYSDSDVSIDPTTGASPVVLNFYNSSNPTQPYQGPNNTGSTSNTFRKGVITYTVKAGVAATTGTQVTPSVDSGFVGLWVVSVPFGATTLTSANISQYQTAPILPSSLLQSIQTDNLTYGVDVGTVNAVQATYPLPITALTENMNLWVRVKSANTGATTFTPNPGVIAAYPVIGGNHSALQGGELVANGRSNLLWRADITSWVLVESSGGALQVGTGTASNQAATVGQVQAGTLGSAVAAGTANALTATIPSTLTTLTNGQPFTLIAAAANTAGVAVVLTLGTTVLSSLAIVKGGNIPLAAGDIPSAGYPIELNYSSTYGALVMQNPATGISTGGQTPIGGNIEFSGPVVPSGCLAMPTAATTLPRATYAALFNAITFQTTGNTNGTTTISNVASTAGVVVGNPISGPGIPAGATVASFIPNTSITLSVAATATAAGVALVIASWGVGDGSTTFGMPYHPTGYAATNSAAAVGTLSVGQVITHTHSGYVGVSLNGSVSTNAGGSQIITPQSDGATGIGSTGGSANLAASVVFKKCVRYI